MTSKKRVFMNAEGTDAKSVLGALEKAGVKPVEALREELAILKKNPKAYAKKFFRRVGGQMGVSANVR